MRSGWHALVAAGLAVCVVPVLGAADSSNSRLVEAVRKQDKALVRTLLKQPGLDVNAPQPDGATALHWAAHRDDVELADLLIKAGANANATNDYGVTPLLLAATNGDGVLVERLLKAGAHPNGALPSGETPLMTASRVGRIDAVKALLAGGADVNAREGLKGQTAVMWAMSEQHLDVARALIAAGADVRQQSTTGFTPLLFAARMGNLEGVKLALANGAKINDAAKDGSTPLVVATVRGHADLAMWMLENGADANADATGFTALHWAVGKWEGQTTHDYPEAPGEWEALVGIKKGKIELIKSLIAHGANVNARLTKSPPRFGTSMFAQIKVDGGTPFWVAALACDVEVMQLLAANGANVQETSDEGTTPLMVAAGVGRVAGDSLIPETASVAATRLAIDLGNDLNAQNNTGYTALHGTAFYGLDEVAKVLVGHGADLDIKNKKGETPLKIAEGTVNQAMLISHPSTAEVLRKLAAEKAAKP